MWLYRMSLLHATKTTQDTHGKVIPHGVVVSIGHQIEKTYWAQNALFWIQSQTYLPLTMCGHSIDLVWPWVKPSEMSSEQVLRKGLQKRSLEVAQRSKMWWRQWFPVCDRPPKTKSVTEECSRMLNEHQMALDLPKGLFSTVTEIPWVTNGSFGKSRCLSITLVFVNHNNDDWKPTTCSSALVNLFKFILKEQIRDLDA